MPKGSEYPGSAEDLGVYRALVERHATAELRGAKNPYTSRNGWMTSFIDAHGVICVRMTPSDRQTAIDSGGAAVEQYGRNMPDFVSVPAETSDADLDSLFSQSWDHVGALEPK